mgnify:CR=1 FL=1
MNKLVRLYGQHKTFFNVTGLGILFYFIFFHNIGNYALMDVDETRYVSMARDMFNTHDYMTLYLNGDYFFEKPPLYFWIECFVFSVFGSINEFTSRFPVVMMSLLPLILLFFLCKKVKDTKFAVISSLTLLTCVEYIFITKLAILDGILTSLVSSACLCYFFTFFVEDKNKKYFWILTYVLTGLSVMAKGIPGLAIPLGTIFFATILFKTYKETLKYSLLGALIVLGIVLPWHVLMLKTYPNLFYSEYIYKHHILRFLGSEVIHRNQPWYFYILTLLWGTFPHVFVILEKIYQSVKERISAKNCKFEISLGDNFEKLIALSLIAFCVILLFFSSSKAKLITYILPAYPFVAILTGKIWMDYIENGNNIINKILCGLTLFFGFIAFVMCFAGVVLPKNLYVDFRPIQFISIAVIVPFVILSLHALKNNKRFNTFLTLTVFISVFVGLLTPFIYKLDYSFGQNDLMRFAKNLLLNNHLRRSLNL